MNRSDTVDAVDLTDPPGYRMPPEWHSHAATLLQWPSNRQTWPGEKLEKIEKLYLELIDILHSYEPIVLLASPEVMVKVEKKLKNDAFDRSQITLIEYPVDDIWARDCGPIFVECPDSTYSDYIIIDWEYNSWGGKYPPYDADNKIPSFLARYFNLPVMRTGMVLEGGAIETNGNGLFLTTESVLLNPNRNPGLSRDEVEMRLSYFLGAEKVIWLKNGLTGDDTDGHIDDIARFVNEKTVLVTLPKDKDDINYPVLHENLEIIKKATDQYDNNIQIEVLPMPETFSEEKTADNSQHVPASYLNFYIANGVVLVPLYDERYDEQVIETIRQYYPDRDVHGVRSSDLVWGQGSIHCITQQLYAV